MSIHIKPLKLWVKVISFCLLFHLSIDANAQYGYCESYIDVQRVFPLGVLCEPQRITLKATYSRSEGISESARFRWYANESDATPIAVTPLVQDGSYKRSEYAFNASATTTLWVSFYDPGNYYIDECGDETVKVPYTVTFNTRAALYQDYARVCPNGNPSVQVSSNVTGASFALYKFGQVFDPGMNAYVTGYEHIAHSTTGYFEIPDFRIDDLERYYATVTPASGGCSNVWYYQLNFELIDQTPSPVISGQQFLCIGSGTVLTASYPGGNFQWFDRNSNLVSTTDMYTVDPNTPPGTYSYKVELSIPGSCSTESAVADVIIDPKPIDGSIAASSSVILLGEAVTLTTSGGAGKPHYWCSSNGGQTWNIFAAAYGGQKTLSFIPPAPGTYRFHTRNKTFCGFCGDSGNGGCPTYPYVDITVLPHKIRETTLLKKTTSESGLENLPPTEKSVTTTYVDGLGRPIQAVNWKASPNQADIVQPFSYDNYGRDSVKYLPYVTDPSLSNGHYKLDALQMPGSTGTQQEQYRSGKQYNFYQTGGLVASDQYPYAETKFEASPLDRILKQGAPGAAWQPNVNESLDNSVKRGYGTNIANDVLLFTYDYATGLVNAGTAAALVYYNANELTINKTWDEHNNESIAYTDKEGHTVCKKIQYTTQGSTTLYATTYYIYSTLGNLAVVIPPEAVSKLNTDYHHAAATNATKETFLATWAFRYTYDAAQRTIQKQVPGAAPVYMVYDGRDRLVMSQDGEQRKTNKWSYTKYDAFNRPIITGIYTHGSAVGQVGMSDLISKTIFYETYTGDGDAANHGYSNTVFPSASFVAANFEVLTVTYYDYGFKTTILNNALFNYISTELTDQYKYDATGNSFPNVKGQVTGTKIKVLGQVPATYLWNVNYFDDHYRVVQSIATNARMGIDRSTMIYDFVGKVIRTKTTHHGAPDERWKDLVGITLNGNNLTKTSENGWGNGGAASIQMLSANTNGWVEMMVTDINSYWMVGLSSTNANANYNSINYAFYAWGNHFQVYENGSGIDLGILLSIGDIMRIGRTGSTISYYLNGALVHTSPTPSTSALLVDVSIYSSGLTLQNITTSFDPKTHTVARAFNYDHAGRLTKTYHSINGAPFIILDSLQYNELGQMITKKLHSTDNGNTFKQSVDYRYNIRGWLNSINDIATREPSDLFSMNLNYNTPTDKGGLAQYNGNISEVLWKGPDAIANSYGYSYDPMNRITNAQYYNADATKNGRFNEKIGDLDNNKLPYDLNGNIKFLSRQGKTGMNALGITTYGMMDDLAYDYGTAGNKLLRVTDNVINNQGFTDGLNPNNDYAYDANGNLSMDNNKSISSITYNYMKLSEEIVKSTGEYLKYTYDASGVKLSQGVYDASNVLKKKTDYVGEFFYERDSLKFINHEEGRIIMTESTPIYQYNLKDHLGNIRVTFTTESETESATATMEIANRASEGVKFLSYDKVRIVNTSPLFDHTNNDANAPFEGSSIRLSGSTNEKTGLVKTLSVMPGDVVNMEVYAKYVDTNPINVDAALKTLLLSISTGATGTVTDGPGYPTNGTPPFPYTGLNGTGTSSSNGPKAYLNYIMFDRDFNAILPSVDPSQTFYVRMSNVASETGKVNLPNGVPHEKLAASVTVKKAGYMYIYLSNEETTPVEVYFDDFMVEQIKSPVIASNDYYPFGLTYNSYFRESSVDQKYLFNGMELQDELNLNTYLTDFRSFDPTIGRWMQIDPKASERESPYVGMANNPMRYMDPLGDTIKDNNKIVANYRTYVSNRVTSLQGMLGDKNFDFSKYGTSRESVEGLVSGLQGINGELDAMDASEQVYNVEFSNDMTAGEGGTTFNAGTGAVDISFGKYGTFDQSAGLVGHEMLHAYQFETGQVSMRQDNAGYGSIYDIGDETGAYQREHLVAGGIGSGGHINNQWTKTFGASMTPPAYQTLPTGPIDINSPQGRHMRMQSAINGMLGRPATEAYKGYQGYYNAGSKHRIP